MPTHRQSTAPKTALPKKRKAPAIQDPEDSPTEELAGAPPPDTSPLTPHNSLPTASIPGRPRVLTPEKQAQLCDLLRLGLTRAEAARFVGLTVRTIFNYERENPDFAETIKQALLDTDSRAYSSVIRAGEQSWRAAAWLISHRSRQGRPMHKPSAEALLKSPRFQEMLRELICEAVVANEIRVDPGVVHRKKRLRSLRAEIESRRRRGEDATALTKIAHDLTREIAKTLRLTMRTK